MYERIEQLANEISRYADAEFYSLTAEGTVAIKNTKTGAIFEVPYTESDKGIVFHGTDGKMVQEPKKSPKDEFNENGQKLQSAIQSFFTEGEYDNKITDLKSIVKTLPTVDPKIFNEETEVETKVEEYSGILEDKVKEYLAIKKEFDESFQLFGDDGQLKENDISITAYNQMLEEVKEEQELFEKALLNYSVFSLAINEAFGPDTADVILKNIDLENDIKKSAPKALVLAKNQIDEAINVIESTEYIIDVWNDIFAEDTINPANVNPVIFNYAQRDRERPRYLKFKMGVFTHEDVMILLEELDHAMSHIGDINDEELEFIANQKAMLEYMVRTRKISDRVIKQIITEFNKRFGKEADDEYTQSQLGFKDREEKDMGNIQGKAEMEPSEGAMA